MEIIGRSDIGKVRKNNEDFIAYDEAKGIAVLADGMGGLDAGEIASRTAVQEIMTKLVALSDVREDGGATCSLTVTFSLLGRLRHGTRTVRLGPRHKSHRDIQSEGFNQIFVFGMASRNSASSSSDMSRSGRVSNSSPCNPLRCWNPLGVIRASP